MSTPNTPGPGQPSPDPQPQQPQQPQPEIPAQPGTEFEKQVPHPENDAPTA